MVDRPGIACNPGEKGRVPITSPFRGWRRLWRSVPPGPSVHVLTANPQVRPQIVRQILDQVGTAQEQEGETGVDRGAVVDLPATFGFLVFENELAAPAIPIA